MKLRALLVGEDATVLATLQHELGQLGCESEVIRWPTAALARAEAAPFDLLFCESRMPEMSGISLVRAFRETQPSIIAIILVGLGELRETMKATHEGTVYRHLTKPINPDKVRAIVHDVTAPHAKDLHRPSRHGMSGADFTASSKGAMADLEAKYPGITVPGTVWGPGRK